MSIVSADPSELETLRSRLIADSNSLSKIGLPDSPDASSTGSDDLASACEDFLSNAKKRIAGSRSWCEKTAEGINFTSQHIGETDADAAHDFCDKFGPVMGPVLQLTFNWSYVFNWDPDKF